jgi:hypothetical protein
MLVVALPRGPSKGDPWTSPLKLDDLLQHATHAKVAVSESREQLRQRIDQAKVDVDRQSLDRASALTINCRDVSTLETPADRSRHDSGRRLGW